MKCERIALQEHYSCVKGGVLKIYCLDNPLKENPDWVRPMVIVVPGGAYRFVSHRENEPVATEFLAKGYHACVLEYLCSTEGVCYPEQLFELACAVDYLKKNAERLFINPKEIFAMGFSAGGHLVADYSLEFPSIGARCGEDLDTYIKAVGLCYPVIDEHDDTFENLLLGYSDKEKAQLKAELKLSDRVTESTPPTFVWTTAKDRLVPAQNSLRYALALSQKGVPYELHVYPIGDHGLSNASLELNDDREASPIVSSWTTEMIRFFRSYCTEKY